MARRWLATGTLGVVLALGGCAAAPPNAPEPPPLAWPTSPDEPQRIAFVKAFTRPTDLGIEKGFLQRVGEFLFGKTDARLVRPMAVLAVKGVVYVSDPGAKGVH